MHKFSLLLVLLSLFAQTFFKVYSHCYVSVVLTVLNKFIGSTTKLNYALAFILDFNSNLIGTFLKTTTTSYLYKVLF